MSLYLVQHGHCLSREQDPKRELSEAGSADIERIGKRASDQGVRVACIHHSGKTRARQTAYILAAHLNPGQGVHEEEGLKPLDDVTRVAATLDGKSDLVLVGHLPFLSRLCSLLLTGNQEPGIVKFQNGGIVCLDQDPDSMAWFLKWTLVPDMN